MYKTLELKCKLYILLKYSFPLLFLLCFRNKNINLLICIIYFIFLLIILYTIFFKKVENPDYFSTKNDKDSIIGFVEYDYKTNWVNKWFVHPKYKNKGLGKQIILKFLNNVDYFGYESYPWYNTDKIIKKLSNKFDCKYNGNYRYCKIKHF